VIDVVHCIMMAIIANNNTMIPPLDGIINIIDLVNTNITAACISCKTDKILNSI
jgi:hypothetical protein